MRILITGGAGFIGTNVAGYLAGQGHQVRVFDDLSRAGVEENARWLRDQYPDVQIVRADIRNPDAVREAVAGSDRIYHLAAQVAVTTSVRSPRHDFEVNLLGTLNVLEAMRSQAPEALLFYTSTNKVYGGMEEASIARQDRRYQYETLPHGVSEETPLDFHSPYGCSKGGADQYVRDYSRIYDLNTVVFRMSCIYGPHQCGNEDQGWVAHFAREALQGRGVTIYGDGCQVRDVLYVEDLVRAFELAAANEQTRGEVFNIGGGPSNSVSLLELLADLERICEVKIPVTFQGWRPGDQRIYVSDIRRAGEQFGWQPKVRPAEGLERLVGWLRAQAR